MQEMSDEAPPELPDDVITVVCGVCGIGIYNHEIAGESIGGTLIDYQNKKSPCQIGFALCKEHYGLIWKNCSDPDAVEKGTIRRAALTDMTAEDQAQIYWKNRQKEKPDE